MWQHYYRNVMSSGKMKHLLKGHIDSKKQMLSRRTRSKAQFSSVWPTSSLNKSSFLFKQWVFTKAWCKRECFQTEENFSVKKAKNSYSLRELKPFLARNRGSLIWTWGASQASSTREWCGSLGGVHFGSILAPGPRAEKAT